jgi:hypothetical protein
MIDLIPKRNTTTEKLPSKPVSGDTLLTILQDGVSLFINATLPQPMLIITAIHGKIGKKPILQTGVSSHQNHPHNNRKDHNRRNQGKAQEMVSHAGSRSLPARQIG